MTVQSTFEDRARHDERESFVGRSVELERLEDVLDERATKRLVLLYGPGGIGKSTLLRRVTSVAASEGYATQYVTARALIESPEVGAGVVARAAEAQRALVAIDGWEEAAASGVALRDDVLAHLPASTIVVIAGRGAPDHEWWSQGWGPSIIAMGLGPLDTADAVALLHAHGVTDRERALGLAAWAQGLPLALVMAAATEWKPGAPDPDRPLLARLSGHLLDGGVPDDRLEPLTVAATARVTTPAILAAAVPGIDADDRR